MKAYTEGALGGGGGGGVMTNVRFFNIKSTKITDNKSTFYSTLLGRGACKRVLSVRFHKC